MALCWSAVWWRLVGYRDTSQWGPQPTAVTLSPAELLDDSGHDAAYVDMALLEDQPTASALEHGAAPETGDGRDSDQLLVQAEASKPPAHNRGRPINRLPIEILPVTGCGPLCCAQFFQGILCNLTVFDLTPIRLLVFVLLLPIRIVTRVFLIFHWVAGMIFTSCPSKPSDRYLRLCTPCPLGHHAACIPRVDPKKHDWAVAGKQDHRLFIAPGVVSAHTRSALEPLSGGWDYHVQGCGPLMCISLRSKDATRLPMDWVGDRLDPTGILYL